MLEGTPTYVRTEPEGVTKLVVGLRPQRHQIRPLARAPEKVAGKISPPQKSDLQNVQNEI